MHVELLEQLGTEEVERDLMLGRVFGPDGKVIPNWVTFRGKHYLIVRGAKHAGSRRCPACGRALYFAMGKGFLYPMPPAGIDIFEGSRFGLVLTERIFDRLDLGKWGKFGIEKLDVPAVPPDALGVLD
jgi:hypothetical protein